MTLNALTVFYAHNLADDGIKINALAPGLRRTDLNATAAASGGDPAEAAAGGPAGETATNPARHRSARYAWLQALSRNSSGSPVSTRLLRLDKIIPGGSAVRGWLGGRAAVKGVAAGRPGPDGRGSRAGRSGRPY